MSSKVDDNWYCKDYESQTERRPGRQMWGVNPHSYRLAAMQATSNCMAGTRSREDLWFSQVGRTRSLSAVPHEIYYISWLFTLVEVLLF